MTDPTSYYPVRDEPDGLENPVSHPHAESSLAYHHGDRSQEAYRIFELLLLLQCLVQTSSASYNALERSQC